MSESFKQSAVEQKNSVQAPEFQWSKELLEQTYGQLDEQKTQDLYKRLQQHFAAFNPLKNQNVTFDNVRETLEKDPDLALKIYIAEMHLGAEMCLVQRGTSFDTAIFDDLAIDLSLQKQSEFFQGIPEPQRNAIINDLRREFPNIPKDAFDRPARLKAQQERIDAYRKEYPHDQSSFGRIGLTKWEGLVIERWLGVSSMPRYDYEFIHESPDGQLLDAKGPDSWLETSSEELTRGRAWYGPALNEMRIVGLAPAVPDECFVRCVRIQAKGSPMLGQETSPDEKVVSDMKKEFADHMSAAEWAAERAKQRVLAQSRTLYRENIRALMFLVHLKQHDPSVKAFFETPETDTDDMRLRFRNAIEALQILGQEVSLQYSNEEPIKYDRAYAQVRQTLPTLEWATIKNQKDRAFHVIPTEKGREVVNGFKKFTVTREIS